MTKFRKGPWFVDSYLKIDNSIRVVEGNVMISYHPDGDNEESKANAHLIASAPDMYAMIKEVADMQKKWYGYGMDTHIKLAKMADKMEALLATARGEK